MALVIADRVLETSSTTGTGTLSLNGATAGYQGFAAAVGNLNTTYYTITFESAGEWEVGIGTYTTSGSTLSRDTVLDSSNSGSLVTFSAGTKQVFVTYPGDKAVATDLAQTLTNKTFGDTPVETVFVLTDASTVDIDPSNGSIQTLTLTSTGRTLTFTNMVAGEAVTLMVNDGTAGTITTWNATFVNNGGVAPVLSTTGFTVVVIWKVSSTVYAAVVGNA
jgi:hypothetical protein